MKEETEVKLKESAKSIKYKDNRRNSRQNKRRFKSKLLIGQTVMTSSGTFDQLKVYILQKLMK